MPPGEDPGGFDVGKTRKMDALCAQCAFYIYDEEYDEYVCDVQMDEDDYYRISEGHYRVCPYYRNGDEYLIVRKQN